MSTDIDPMAQNQAEAEILRLSRQLTEITQDVAEAARNDAKAEVAYKIAYAKRRLHWMVNSEGTVGEKDARTMVEVENEYTEHKIAEAVFKACQESGRNVRAQLDALRSINANLRDVVRHGG